LPQAAWRIDSTPQPLANEILCDVDVLNIDSASFKQIADANGCDPYKIGEHVRANVALRGKQHNPVTGSGGMFVGRVRQLGSDLRLRAGIAEGDRIASLVSLTLTPLMIDEILDVDVATGRIWIRGQAILFESGLYSRMPDDLPEDVALAVFDVAGAPAQVRRLAQPGQTVLVIGADGKSGLLSCAQARERVGTIGRVLGVVPDAHAPGARLLLEGGFVDALIEADARHALDLFAHVERLAPELADLTVNCVNVGGTELGSILCTRDLGTVYFFSMATSFTAAALGAEGAAKDVTMIVGNGYAEGHAAIALQTLRDRPELLALFAQRYGARAVS
jgi:L-erythro-3,5-diaminohexanoate dehydrogenase